MDTQSPARSASRPTASASGGAPLANPDMLDFSARSLAKRLLQTLLVCVGIATVQHLFLPGLAFEVPLVYSLCIGLLCWAMVDLGRGLFPSARLTGWPAGSSAVLLPVGAMAISFALGSALADYWFGWSTFDGSAMATKHLRRSIGVSALAGLAVNYYFYSRGKARFLIERLQAAQHQNTQAQLRLLQAQLEPHMLFNTLANLRSLIASDPVRAQTMLDHLIDFLRATLHHSRSAGAPHSLAQEFARLDDYLALMAIRMGPRLHYQLDLPPALASQPIAPMLLQPLVENCIVHGLEPLVAGGALTVSAIQQGETLVITVADTGVGYTTGPKDAVTGFGLQQVRERLHTLYGVHADFFIHAAPGGGTIATVRIPLHA